MILRAQAETGQDRGYRIGEQTDQAKGGRRLNVACKQEANHHSIKTHSSGAGLRHISGISNVNSEMKYPEKKHGKNISVNKQIILCS